MKLKNLLTELEYVVDQGSIEREVTMLCYHTKQIEHNSVFVCIVGEKSNGHQYIKEAINKGAVVLVVSEMVHEFIPDTITIIRVEDTRHALSYMSATYFDYPAKKLKMIGVTGTKGKTTTTYMIKEILEMAGIKTCLIGTIETIIGTHVIPSNNTTPESYLLQKYLKEAVDTGCECTVMEVSSQGLKQKRVDGIIFQYAVFMNLSPDHIGKGEHADFDEYFCCKKQLFSQCEIGIFNVDDPYSSSMMVNIPCEIETFGVERKAKYQAMDCCLVQRKQFMGSYFDLVGWYDSHITLSMPGLFNIYNALAAIAVVSHFGIKSQTINFAMSNMKVKGRVEVVPVDAEYIIMIDYAHNSMSLRSMIETIRQYQPRRIICLFGCGGNRSRARRFEMGEVSSELADHTVVTNDNPRFENPAIIIEDIVTGVIRHNGSYSIIPDRKEAIRFCMKEAQPGDVIILAGKGHETYQEICGVKYPMDERILIQEICREEEQRSNE